MFYQQNTTILGVVKVYPLDRGLKTIGAYIACSGHYDTRAKGLETAQYYKAGRRGFH
jgi:hypothetical protein